MKPTFLKIANLFNTMAQMPELLEQIDTLVNMILTTHKAGGKVIVFGNGGSAAEAQHFVAELIVKYNKVRKPIAAITIDAASTLTAIGNDFGYDQAFIRQLVALIKPEDLVIGISTSGKSRNVLAGLIMACGRTNTVLLTGAGVDHIALAGLDLVLAVPETETARIQEAHLAIIHIVCDALDSLVG